MATQSKSKNSGIESVVADVQGKAKLAYAKGSVVAGELGAMTKGNVAAVVSSGKILGAGLKELGGASVAEGKQVAETLTGDFKALTSVKSPMEFFQLQMKLAQRNFETALALGSKNGKAIGKLASDAAAPLSAQVKANVAKVRQAA